MTQPKALAAEALYRRCDPEQFSFETTDELEDLLQIIGQPRAVEAMHFGVNIEQKGYNIFALGPTGTGKRALVRQLFGQKATGEPVPDDWCYVNNFQQSYKPKALRLPPGRGMLFRQDMEALVEELRTVLPTAFESDEYHTRRQEIEEEFREFQSNLFEEINQQAQGRDLTLLRTPVGFVFAPVRDGQVLAPEEIQKLPEERRQQLESGILELQEELQKSLRQAPRRQRELRDKLKELNREFANLSVESAISELHEKYTDLPEVVGFLNEVQQDIIENVKDFLPQEESQSSSPQALLGQLAEARSPGGSRTLRRYQVNVLVDHSNTQGAPVIYEDNAAYHNLLGRTEHTASWGR